MLYVVIAEEEANHPERREAARPAHMQRMAGMQAAGKVIISGPCPAVDSLDPGPAGFSGSIMIVDFDSLAAATEWANADPYVAAGVFKKVTVKPFKKGFPR